MSNINENVIQRMKHWGVGCPIIGLEVYVIHRRKPTPAKVTFVGINYENGFLFHVLRGNYKGDFQMYEFFESDIGNRVFFTKEEAEEAIK